MKRVLVVWTLLLAMCWTIVAFGQASIGAASPFFGTWKLNVAKSKWSPGPALKSQTAKIEPTDGGMKVSSDRVDSEGKQTHFEWTAKFDGKDYPVKGDANRDAVSLKKIDDHTLE